jgi:hypothetical protein
VQERERDRGRGGGGFYTSSHRKRVVAALRPRVFKPGSEAPGSSEFLGKILESLAFQGQHPRSYPVNVLVQRCLS